MNVRSLVAVVAFLVAFIATPAASQVTAIGPGQSISGRLDSGDSQLTDESFYDFYEYRGQPGEVIVVTLRSSEFDAYLQGGPAPGGDVSLEDTDDDGVAWYRQA